MRISAFIQARMGSTRLPGKVLLPLGQQSMLDQVVNRVRLCPLIADVVVVTGESPLNEPIAKRAYIETFSGSDDDVCDRYFAAAIAYEAKHVLRITADCPFVDPDVLSDLIKQYCAFGGRRYFSVSTGTPNNDVPGPRYPDGLDAELFSFADLAFAWTRSRHDLSAREHVTSPLVNRDGRMRSVIMPPVDLGALRLTVDTPDDYTRAGQIVDALGWDCRLDEIVGFLKGVA